jgi:hypothetical protein
MWATSGNFRKEEEEENNHPMGKKSPNQVTLLRSLGFSIDI